MSTNRLLFFIGLAIANFANLAHLANADVVTLDYRVVESYPQDRSAFTQGLFYNGETLVLGTGLFGSSSIRHVNLKTGETLQHRILEDAYFGEGVVSHGELLYQLTWKAGIAFVYSAKTLRPVASLHYRGEGWGLTSDGSQLIMSDGSSKLTGRDPKTFRKLWNLSVTMNGRPVGDLNELEYINGRIFANVYRKDTVVVIHPGTGAVDAVINFSPLVDSMHERNRSSGVLNGIAWDARRSLLLVTGKNWDRLFAVRLGAP